VTAVKLFCVEALIFFRGELFRSANSDIKHMHSNRPHGRVNRYSAKTHLKPINFYCNAPEAAEVFISGDFNDWNPTSHRMEKQHDGTWFAQLQLNHGHHHYLFIIDGKPTLDPRAQGIGRNELNEKVSLIAVS
jgi:1,4-alpha-glucan branching enzyme